MSKLIPSRTVSALRKQVDISLDMYGIDCTLYIPTNLSITAIEQLDVYMVPNDLTYIQYSTKVFIEWSASVYKLRKLGLYTEDGLPIIAWFPNKANDISNVEQDIDITRHSYFTIDQQFIPNEYGSDSGSEGGAQEFEIVDIAIRGMHDAVIRKAFRIAPRRVE